MPKAKKKDEASLIGSLADIPEESFAETGVAEVDELLGGGWPRRRITQVYGMPGVGKGYLLTQTLKLNKHKVLYVDAEYALNAERLKADKVDFKLVDHMANSQLEEVANYIVDNVNKYDVIVIDSLAALTPMTIQENEVGTSSIGLAARQIGHFNARLRPELFKSNCAIIGINQVRANMGFGQAESKPAGGFAWNHTIDLSLKLFKTGTPAPTKQVKGVKYTLGHICGVKVDKSRISDFGAETRFLVDYGIEVDGVRLATGEVAD